MGDLDAKVLGGLTRADLSHVGIHGGIVVLAWLTGTWEAVHSFDPLTAAVVSVLGVEGVDIIRGFGLTEVRDLIFRSLGAAIGWGLGWLLVLVL